MKLKKKGFTLIELLVVIAIIGIIAVIVISGLDLIRSKGRDARRIADIKQLNGAIENYFDSCHSFPTSLIALGVPDCNGNTYISAVPTDPETGQTYNYYVTSSGANRFHLCADLEIDFGDNKGKARVAPFNESDGCDGTQGKVFDVTGGALGQ